MTTSEPKSSTTPSVQHSSTAAPFFQQEESKQGFFGSVPSQEPFFKAAPPDGNKPKSPTIQTKLTIGAPDDIYEQEADAMAEKVVQRMETDETKPGLQEKLIQRAGEEEEEPGLQTKRIQRAGGEEEEPGLQAKRIQCLGEEEEEPGLQAKGAVPGLQASADLESRLDSTKGSASPLPDSTRASMESSFGTDFSGVRGHTISGAVQMNQEVGSQAAEEEQQLIAPLTDVEWSNLDYWLATGEVGIEPFTEDPNHNALLVAESIFCSRFVFSSIANRGDPLLCVISDITRTDPRVQQIVQQVTARGPIMYWARVDPNQRMLHVMELLVNQYHFPVNGAAGLVGNLMSESGLLPNIVEEAQSAAPMRAPNSRGRMTDFTPSQVMNQSTHPTQGPRKPGVGLAQWTTESRRTGLFQHQFQGRQLGAGILGNMDAQVDYLVSELQSRFANVHRTITASGVSVNDAADEVVYRFEVPGAVLDTNKHLLPRTNSAVQRVFAARRANAQRALRVHQQAQQE